MTSGFLLYLSLLRAAVGWIGVVGIYIYCFDTQASIVQVFMVLEPLTYTVRGRCGRRRGGELRKKVEFLLRGCGSKKSKIFT